MAATTAATATTNLTSGASSVVDSIFDSETSSDGLLQPTTAFLSSFQFGEPIPQTKLIVSLVLFFITLLSGYLPVRMIVNQKCIQHAMFAGGGVLMATAFCHLIPETHDAYNKHLDEAATTTTNTTTTNTNSTTTTTTNNGTTTTIEWPQFNNLSVPYPEVFLCCGFFFMYLAEQLMVKFINNHSHEHPCDVSAPNSSSTGRLMVGVQVDEVAPHKATPSGGQTSGNGTPTTGTSTGNLSTSAIVPPVGGSSSSNGATNLYKFLRGLLIVSAFMAHSIFDGVAIGSQETAEKVWTIFAAISCHKLIIAAVVGLELYAATLESHLWTLVHLSIFSLMSPIGIILVVVAQNSLKINSDDPSMILLQSFATGTLLYIIFVEVLQPKQLPEQEKNKLGKSISLIAGFSLMLVVLTLIDA